MIDFRFDFRYDGEKEPALKNTGGTIESGKCIMLCGGSGCGKSTLLRLSLIHISEPTRPRCKSVILDTSVMS